MQRTLWHGTWPFIHRLLVCLRNVQSIACQVSGKFAQVIYERTGRTRGRSQKPDDVHFSWFVDVTQTCFVLFLRPFLPKILRRRAKNEKEEDPVPVSLLHPIDLHMYARTSYILFYSIRLHGRYLSFDGTWKEDALLTDLRGSSSSNSSPVPLLQKGLHVCLHPALQFANKLIYHQNELVASQQNKVNSF